MESGSAVQEGSAKPSRWVAIALLTGFMGLYLLNLQFTPAGDATPNVLLAMSLLEEGNLTLTPAEAPQLFFFRMKLAQGDAVVRFSDWDSLSPLLVSWRQLAREGRLEVEQPQYYLVPAADPEQRGYVSAFGPGAAITAAPYYALQRLVVPDLKNDAVALWYGSKFIASLCVALSVVFVYWTVQRQMDFRYALGIAICYGAGTCVWSVSSQTLWQNGPNILWISIAAYCLARTDDDVRWAIPCGAAAGMAVLCRSTSVLLVIALGAHFAAWSWHRWRSSRRTLGNSASRGQLAWQIASPLVYFVAAGMPLALLLIWHNMYCFKSPLASPHLASGGPLALETLGSNDIWQTPLLTGLAGLLFSASRGMLIFSPILAAGLWGAVSCWREERWRPLRPLAVGIVLIILVTAKHFNWHGGWSYGYRAIVDLAPLLAICCTAVAAEIWRKPLSRLCFGAALAWSVMVQVIGAYAYDLDGWNNRPGYIVLNRHDQPAELLLREAEARALAAAIGGRVETVRMNVDYAVHRRRLWSLADNQIGYYLLHWSEGRQQKEAMIAARLHSNSALETITVAKASEPADQLPSAASLGGH